MIWSTPSDPADPHVRTPAPISACPALLEREREIAFLRRVADAVEQGAAQLVMLSGEAGAGKSRLAQEFLAQLPESWRQLRLSAESGAPRPAGTGLDDPAGGEESQLAIGTTLASALASARGSGPLVAVLEDCERLDPVAVAALGAAVDMLHGEPVLVVAMFRLGEHAPGSPPARMLAEVLRHPFAHEVPLPPLSPAAVIEMSRLLARDLGADAGDLHERTGGNPFFTEEVLLAAPGSVPWTVTEAVMARLDPLPTGASRAAQLLAVAADPVSSALLEEIGGGDTGPLLDAGIARQDSTGYVSLRHALVAEVVVARMNAADRRAAHETIARALASDDRVAPARLARHWSEAGNAAQAAHYAVIAADRAARDRAYRSATELYAIALLHRERDGDANAELLDRAAVAAGWAGLAPEALRHARAADAAYRKAGQPRKAVAMWLSPALENLPKPALDRSLLDQETVEGLLQDAQDDARARRYDRSAELAQRALQLIAETGADPIWEIAAAQRLIGAGRLDEGEQHLQRIRALAVAGGDPHLVERVLALLSETAMTRGDLNAALLLDQQAATSARRRGEAGAWGYENGVALIHAFRGELEAATRCVEQILALDIPIAAEFAQYAACEIDLQRGQLDDAAARLDRLAAVRALGVDRFTAGVLFGRAKWHALRGDAPAALAVLAEIDEITGDIFDPSRLDRLVLQCRLAIAQNDDELLARTARTLGELVMLGAGSGIEAAATWSAALVDFRVAHAADAATRLAGAATLWETAGRFLLAAEAWCDIVEIASSEDAEMCAHAAERAREIADRYGLVNVTNRLDSLDRPLSADVPEALRVLSAREREIVALVVEGKTNRQIGEALFISEHTVRNQLVSVFEKLGVSRRTELARVVTTAARPTKNRGDG